MIGRSAAGPLRAGFAVLTLVAVGFQLRVHLTEGLNAVNFFSYFTNLSNLSAAIVLLIAARRSPNRVESRIFDLVRATVTDCMLVVGIVFALLLRNADLGSLQPWVNFVVHYVMPVVVVLDWTIWPPSTALRFREFLLCLLAPSAYLAYVLLRGAVIGWYPYPFLNPAAIGGYGGVALYALGITGVFLLGAALLLGIGRWRSDPGFA